MTTTCYEGIDFSALAKNIKQWANAFGFQQLGISDVALDSASNELRQWLAQQWHGSMSYMQRHVELRADPAKLLPGTIRIICARMNYQTETADKMVQALNDRKRAYIARYALGRDYHKFMRKRLTQLALKIQSQVGPYGFRAFVDSAPVLEKPLARKAGLGWQGKNTLILNRQTGSWFFLGEIFTDLPLPIDRPVTPHCGSCHACIDVCPTKAIVAPYRLDARRCIAYLTIEHKGSIPVELRSLMGNRIFGCDDCQLFCPWNKFAKLSQEQDFTPRHGLQTAQLIELFLWSEQDYLRRTEGSPLRRCGYSGWLRNIAVALGNAPTSNEVVNALNSRIDYADSMVVEHIKWAIQQHNL